MLYNSCLHRNDISCYGSVCDVSMHANNRAAEEGRGRTEWEGKMEATRYSSTERHGPVTQRYLMKFWYTIDTYIHVRVAHASHSMHVEDVCKKIYVLMFLLAISESTSVVSYQPTYCLLSQLANDHLPRLAHICWTVFQMTLHLLRRWQCFDKN